MYFSEYIAHCLRDIFSWWQRTHPLLPLPFVPIYATPLKTEFRFLLCFTTNLLGWYDQGRPIIQPV